MSFKGEEDKDRDNKISLFNFFFNNGFTPRLEIPLYEFFKGERLGKELTDLDVFGFKYIPFVGIIKITASAKGEAKNISHTSEIFKLKGINEYFLPFKSYYIHDKSPTDELYGFGKKLGIEIFSKSSFSNVLNRLQNKFMLSKTGADAISQSLLITKDLGYYNFITSEFWLSKQPDKIYKLESILKKIFEKNINIGESKNFLLILYLISLYIICTIEIIEKVHNVAGTDFEYKLKLIMHGGKNQYKNTIQLIDGFKKYLKEFDKSNANFFNYDVFIPKFNQHLELFKRVFVSAESLYLALYTFDYIMFFFAESDVINDINNVIKEFSFSVDRIEKGLSFLRYLFSYFINKVNPKLKLIAKKLNILR